MQGWCSLLPFDDTPCNAVMLSELCVCIACPSVRVSAEGESLDHLHSSADSEADVNSPQGCIRFLVAGLGSSIEGT